MHYFIDGYNMLFRLLHGIDNLQRLRESIIHDLNKKISLLKLDASIVFDSTFQIGDRSRSHYEKLEILFSAEGETADEYILDELKNTLNPTQETVVTSDKKLAWQVRNRSAHTESVEDFIRRLNRAYKNKLRRLKKGEQPSFQPPAPALSSPSSSPRSSLIPDKEAPLEAYADYYAQVFESEWDKMVKEEQMHQQETIHDAESRLKRTSRKPKRTKDPFQITEAPEVQEATEMERWQKLFEKRGSDPDSDF